MLNLPRLSVRTAFAITGWIAVWRATFQLQSSLGSDLRAFMQFLILLASIACANNYRDERRAFWIGFAFVLILYSVSVLRDALSDSILRFNWLVNIRRELTDDSVITWAAWNTAHYGAILVVSTIGDCIFLAIYRQAHQRSD